MGNMKVYDYQCPECDTMMRDLFVMDHEKDTVKCSRCGSDTERLVSSAEVIIEKGPYERYL